MSETIKMPNQPLIPATKKYDPIATQGEKKSAVAKESMMANFDLFERVLVLVKAS